MSTQATLRTIAGLEFAKGVLASIASIGLLITNSESWHSTLQSVFGSFAQMFHLSKESVSFITLFSQKQQLEVALGLLAYGIVRLIEGFGLWRKATWAKWLGIVSGCMYLPFEVYGLILHPTHFTFLVLLLNITIVLYLFGNLRNQRLHGHEDALADSTESTP